MNRRKFIWSGLSSAWAARFGRITPSQTNPLIKWMWSGALSTNTITIKAKLVSPTTSTKLIYSTHSNLSEPLTQTASAINSRQIATYSLAGLQSDTQYHYAIEVDGVLDSQRGRFRTPAIGAYSFSVCFASCARSNSTSQVFQRIADFDPLLFIHLGDMHYENIAINDPNLYHAAYDMTLGSAAQTPLYHNVPVAYIWDDHDFGPNNSDKLSPSRQAARSSYQEAVPHHPLVAGTGDVPICRAFTLGRVRFILTDARSERDSNTLSPNDPNKTMLGAAQKAWLKQELLSAQQSHAAIVWACSVPWMADFPNIDDDKWNGFSAERTELANFIHQNNINKLFYIAGDTHMLAADDGRNNLYASGATCGFPIFQAGALDQGGSFLPNNTYSEGQWPREHQFGILNVTDNGGDVIGVDYIGRNIWFGDRITLKLTSPKLANNVYLPIVSK